MRWSRYKAEDTLAGEKGSTQRVIRCIQREGSNGRVDVDWGSAVAKRYNEKKKGYRNRRQSVIPTARQRATSATGRAKREGVLGGKVFERGMKPFYPRRNRCVEVSGCSFGIWRSVHLLLEDWFIHVLPKEMPPSSRRTRAASTMNVPYSMHGGMHTSANSSYCARKKATSTSTL